MADELAVWLYGERVALIDREREGGFPLASVAFLLPRPIAIRPAKALIPQ